MKIRKRPAALTAALFMILLWTIPADAGQQTTGYLDRTDGRTVYGWAWDPSSPASAVDVQISVRNTEDHSLLYTQTCSAGLYREDLRQIGDGFHAFAADLDLSSFSGGSCLIEASSQGAPLNGTLYWQGEAFPIQTESPDPPEIPHRPLGPLSGSDNSLAAADFSTDNAAENAFSTDIAAAVSSPAVPEAVAAPQPLSLGTFRTTAYCSCRRCSGRWGRLTSTGAVAVSHHTVAVDPQIIPYGTKLMIDGIVYTAEDEGSGVRGRHIDIYCDTHAEAAASYCILVVTWV